MTTTTPSPNTVPKAGTPEAVERHRRQGVLREIARRADRAEALRASTQRELEAEIVKAHGPVASGHLSYDEISHAIGRSKGRVIQIIKHHRATE